MFSYVCTACGKKTPADTLSPVCGCGGLFELDFKSPKWEDAKIDQKCWSIFRYRDFMAVDGDAWQSVSLGEGMTPLSGAIDHFPKIVALQSEYCAPLLKARELGLDAPVSIDVKPTIAEGIAIGKPLRGSELLEMMKKHDITVVAAPEDKILAARAKIARAGLYIEHTTAANFAAWDHYCELYGLSTDVLITLCGAGIKSDH